MSIDTGGDEQAPRPRKRLASAADLAIRLDRGAAVGSAGGNPPQAPEFLADLPPRGQLYTPCRPATRRLKTLIEAHYYKAAFEAAVSLVAAQNIPELKRIETLEQFYFYADALVTWIPEIRVWEMDGNYFHERTPYLRITQFYYYFNQPQLRDLQSPIDPIAGAILSPLSLWLRDFASEWGEFLDTPESSKFLESFKWAPEYSWQDYAKRPEEYATFNAYFGRTFRDIDLLRPIAAASDDRVVAFPAESTFVGQWAVGTPVGDPLPAPASIVVKHVEWPIEELLQDSAHAADFEGGLLCHSFLNTFDYHRQHAPVAGRIIEAKFIAAQVYLKVALETLDKSQREGTDPALARTIFPHRYLDAADETGYQFLQCRGLLLIESAIGKVAVLPMGMAQVSSVVFVTPAAEGQRPITLSVEEKAGRTYLEQVDILNSKLRTALVGKQLAKGEMFSYFQFGGSDIVTVFERRANLNVTAAVGTHYPVRSQFAVSNINR